MKIDLPPDIKIIVLPLISLLILAVFGVVILKLGFAKFMTQQKQISDTQQEIRVLEQKNTILSSVSPSIAQNANLFSFALPGEDSTAMVISQLRTLSSSTGVVINSMSSRPNTKENIMPGENISLNISGPVTAAFDFLNNLPGIAPLVLVNTAILGQDKSGNSGNSNVDIIINSYWSPYPVTIPATTEPINDLSASEKDMISQMANLKIPVFAEPAPQEATSSRSNPF
ncbi:MAG: hypothetical protein ABSA43_01180 [Candidatus Microgenomates bacterium]|jgi:hypothetical protein